jgi:hypothetical protein
LFITCKPAISNQSTAVPLGQPLNYQITSSESGAGVTYSAYGMPQGLAVDPASGLITGSPPATGVFLCLVTVSNRGASASAILTLTVTVSALDNWRLNNFGTYNNTGPAADGADPDGDGQSNLSEYAACTDPNKGSDFFRILTTTRTVTSYTVTATGKATRTYVLERRATLDAGPWTVIDSTGPFTADGNVTLSDENPPAASGFYRLRVTAP